MLNEINVKMKIENNGKALPILSFPCTSLMGMKTDALVHSSELQAKGMKAVADRTDAAASVSMMDLSVEAEAFGAEVRFSPDEVPSIVGAVVGSSEEAERLVVPSVGVGRTGVFVEAIRLAKGMIGDRPVLAGMIGPFSLAGRILDVTRTMLYLVDEPGMVHAVLRKGTDFLIAYAKALKAAGADGIVMAEPLAGLISPRMAAKFSASYVKEVVDAVQTADFPLIYHNCGGNVIKQAGSIFGIGAAGYHFGNAISMKEMLSIAPKDVYVMGNVDPAGELADGTPESIRAATLRLLEECCPGNPNFIVSSGCDIPPHVSWKNLDAFFAAVNEYFG